MAVAAVTLSLMVALAVPVVVRAQAGPECVKTGPCSCRMVDGSGTLDLSPLNNGTKPRFHDLLNNEYLYSWNPCEPFNEGTNEACQNIAVCQTSQSQAASYSLGTQDSAQFFRNQDGQLLLRYTQPDTHRGRSRTSNFILYCDKGSEGDLEVVGEVTLLYYVFHLHSRYACVV